MGGRRKTTVRPTDDDKRSYGRTLASADELHDLDLGAWRQNRLRPGRLLHDAAVEFDCHLCRFQFQLPEKAENGLPLRGGPRFTIDHDVDHTFG